MKQHARIILISIFLVALLLRIYPLQPWQGWDETVYLQHAEHIVSGKSNFDEFNFRPPVLPILIAGAYLIWHSPYAAAILIALLTASTVFGLYLLCRRLHSAEAGVFAAALYAVHPLFVHFGHLIFTDALVGTFLVFSVYFLLDDAWWSTAVAGVLAGIMALTKFSGFAMLPIMATFLLYHAWNETGRGRTSEAILQRAKLTSMRVIIFIAATSAVVIPYFLWAKANYGSYLATLTRAQELVDLPVSDPLFYLHHQLFTIPIIAGLILFVLYWGSNKKSNKDILPFAAFAATGSITIFVYLTQLPYKHPRFGLLAISLLIALAGIGYATFTKSIRWKHAAPFILVIIVAFSFTAVLRLAQSPVSNWKYEAIDTAEEINTLNAKTGKLLPIYASADYPFYGYYTNNTVIVVDSPQFLNIYTSLNESGYLIVRKDYTRLPTAAWASEQPLLTKVIEDDFTIVYLYSPPQ